MDRRHNEPSTFLSLLGSKHAGNIPNIRASNMMRFSQANMTTDEEERNRHNRAEQVIAEEAPIAPIYQYTNGRLIKPWLKGYPIENPEDVAYSYMLYVCYKH